MVEKLLDDRLAIASRDADDWVVVAHTPVTSDLLERTERLLHLYNISIRIALHIGLNRLADEEGAHPMLIELGDVFMSVARGGTHSKEEAVTRRGELTTIGQDMSYRTLIDEMRLDRTKVLKDVLQCRHYSCVIGVITIRRWRVCRASLHIAPNRVLCAQLSEPVVAPLRVAS